MNPDELRAIQAPLKQRYRETPEAALITLRAQGRLADGITCKIETGKALVSAGLHAATGGSSLNACSGDMLLEALIACAGVTLNAVATALGIEVRDATIEAEGDLDFRGTLGFEGGPSRLPEYSPALPLGHGRIRGGNCQSAAPYGAVLRCLPDTGSPARPDRDPV